MAGNCREGMGEELLEHIMAVPSAYTNSGGGEGAAGYGRVVESMPMVLQLGGDHSLGIGVGMAMPLGLNLEPGFVTHQHHQHSSSGASGDNVVEGNDHHHQLHLNNNHHQHHLNTANNGNMSSSSSTSGITKIRDSMHMRGMHTTLGQLQSHAHAHARCFRPTVPSHAPPQLHPHQHLPLHRLQPQTHPISIAAAAPQPPGIRPRVRARRGQATDPHSIAERLRRERIAERMRALQELVPTSNKTDRAVMLDEIVDYVKFLRLQVKVLSMSRLGGAGAIAQLVADVPLSALEGEDTEGRTNQQAWEKWSNDGTEQEVAKLMEEDVGAAMQFLQSKALCIMPISLASAIFCTPESEPPTNNHQA